PGRGYAFVQPAHRPDRPRLPPLPALVSSFPAIPVPLAHTASRRRVGPPAPHSCRSEDGARHGSGFPRDTTIDPGLAPAKCRTHGELLPHVWRHVNAN